MNAPGPWCGCSLLTRPAHRQPCPYRRGDTFVIVSIPEPPTARQRLAKLEQQRLAAQRALAQIRRLERRA